MIDDQDYDDQDYGEQDYGLPYEDQYRTGKMFQAGRRDVLEARDNRGGFSNQSDEQRQLERVILRADQTTSKGFTLSTASGTRMRHGPCTNKLRASTGAPTF
jgi:hypothetical protein